MKIKNIFSAPLSTVIVVDEKLPEKINYKYVLINNRKYKVTGVPTNDNYSFMIDEKEKFKEGQKINFIL